MLQLLFSRLREANEIPSFDVINGTTRVSDPLGTPNLRSSLYNDVTRKSYFFSKEKNKEKKRK
jgi:hypothetical protein